MKTKRPLEAKNGNSRPLKSPDSSLAVVIRHLLLHPNSREAMQLVERQARLEFDRDTVGLAHQLRVEEVHLNADLQQSDERLAHLRGRLRETKEFDRVAPDAAISFRQWPLKDRALFIVAILLSVTVVSMGAANVYANLVGSGLPVFVDTPALALLLTAIVPSSAFVLHSAYRFLQNERSRTIYARMMFGTTAVLILAWTLSFADQFANVSNSISFDLEGNSHGGSLFVWLQLASEISLGSALGLIADDIATKHTPGRYQRTAEYQEVESALKTQEAAHNRLRNQYVTVARKIRETESARDAAANLAVAEFSARKARFEAYQSDTY